MNTSSLKCARCHESERMDGQAYCRECRAIIQREYLDRKVGPRLKRRRALPGQEHICVQCRTQEKIAGRSLCRDCQRIHSRSRYTGEESEPIAACIVRNVDLSATPVKSKRGIQTPFGFVPNRSYLPEYQTWQNMKRRCDYPRAASYRYYGGRGITVCERWRDSFEAFYADMGPRPSDNHSIDRIDHDGNYEPLNCKWSLQSEQLRNRRAWQWKPDDRDRMGVIQKAIEVQKQRGFKGEIATSEGSAGGSLAPDALRSDAAHMALSVLRERFGSSRLHEPIQDSLHSMEIQEGEPSAKVFNCYGANTVEDQAQFLWVLSHLDESEMQTVLERMENGDVGSLGDTELESIREKLRPLLGVTLDP